MSNIIGGPGMNSRLSLSVREKHGLVYAIDAQYHAYSDTGMFAIYFGTEPKQVKKCMTLIRKEMDKLCQQAIERTGACFCEGTNQRTTCLVGRKQSRTDDHDGTGRN